MGMKCHKCNADNPETQQFCGECGTQLGAAEDISVSHTKTLQTPISDLTRGTTFASRYEIIEELGKGGMGRVYRVDDKKIKEEVALKLIKPEVASDKETIERFSNELKIARKIAHRNVCKMYDLGEEEGAHYITMEYVSGEDLRGMIRMMGQLSAGKVISISKQVCEGLAEAHRLGVVHRDLKPSNIMIDKEGNARIMDFGIARSLKAKGITGMGVMIGTPEYMSPEQAEAKEVDQRSDIYSLGVIVYEMATGRLPFEGDSPLSIAMKHKGEVPEHPRQLNAQVPEDLSHMILRCLEKDKEKRYQSAEELLSELSNIEKGIPTTERVVPKRKTLTSKEITVTFRLKKLLLPASVIIVLAIMVVIFRLYVFQRGEVSLPPEKRASIAVISFENQTGDAAFDHLKKVIPNLLITSLEQSGYFYVATWERMHDIVKQMGKEDVEVIDRDLGFELCRMEGIDAIVLGSFAKAGNMFATDVKILEVMTKKLLKSASSKGEGEASIIKTQIDELSEEISRGVGLSERKIESSKQRIADVTTTSMEAYDYFLRGAEAFDKFYWDDARKFLEKAVEVDPTFASAFYFLGWVNRALGNTRAMSEAFEKAHTFSQKATDKESLYIDSAYAHFIENNPEKGLRILIQMAKKYPREKSVHYVLGWSYMMMKSFDEAIEEYNKVLELDPSHGVSMNQVAYIYADMGNFEKAIEYLKRYASVSPGDANPIDSMAEIYLKMGKLEEAIAKYKEVLEIKPDFSQTSLTIGYIYALKENYPESLGWVDRFIDTAPSPGVRAEGYVWRGFYHLWLGSLDHSLSDIRIAIDLALAVGNERLKGLLDWMKGWIYLDRGELELSQKFFKSLFDNYVKNFPQFIPRHKADYSFHLGLVDLKQGRLDSAKSRLSEMKSLLPEIDPADKDRITFEYDLLHGELLLAEDAVEKTISVCRKISSLNVPTMHTQYLLPYNLPFLRDVLARAYRKRGELDKAITEYERLITFDPLGKERRFIHPKFHYRLAKLYEEKGWNGKAIEQYNKFLDLWKDADPGIVEMDDTKKRLTVLQNQ